MTGAGADTAHKTYGIDLEGRFKESVVSIDEMNRKFTSTVTRSLPTWNGSNDFVSSEFFT